MNKTEFHGLLRNQCYVLQVTQSFNETYLPFFFSRSPEYIWSIGVTGEVKRGEGKKRGVQRKMYSSVKRIK